MLQLVLLLHHLYIKHVKNCSGFNHNVAMLQFFQPYFAPKCYATQILFFDDTIKTLKREV